MSRVYLSIGSNVSPAHYVREALRALTEAFGELTVSSVYESESVGFSGDNFLNLVVGLDTAFSVGELSRWLKALEDAHGRRRDGPRFSPRTLDVDILLYDDRVGVEAGVTLPREEILTNAFVLRPLAEIAPEAVHPVEQETYARLWQDYEGQQTLWPVDFIWRGERISPRG